MSVHTKSPHPAPARSTSAWAALLVRNHAPQSAVGADIAGMREVLEGAGLRTVVFAGEGTDCRPLRELARAFLPPALTILHHSIAWPAGTASFLRARGPRVFRYHNITPPRSFLPFSPAWAIGAALGRAETRLVLARNVLARNVLARGDLGLVLPASSFSATELIQRGAPAQICKVLAPYERPAAAVRPDPSTLARLTDGRKNLLFVGRLAPHKGQHHLIEAVVAWRARWPEEPVRLVLVGGCDPRLVGYRRRLERSLRRHGLQYQVELMGTVSAEVLEACYQAAHVFLLASHHEGFCLPIIESFRRGVPVVAVGRTAVLETAGPAAVILPGFDPLPMAQAAHRVVHDDAARGELIAAGIARLTSRFGRDQWKADCAALLNAALPGIEADWATTNQ